MPTNLPWIFIAGAFVVIALVRLVHKQVMLEAKSPHLTISPPNFIWTNLQWVEQGPRPIQKMNAIAIGYVEIANRPQAAVGALPAKRAWARATFVNEATGEKKTVRYCRWTENPKPRSDEHMTELPVRYNSEWNFRTLEPNGAPNRLDFFIKHLGGDSYGFCGAQQESAAWIDANVVLWDKTKIRVTLEIEAENLLSPVATTFLLDLASKEGFAFLEIPKRRWRKDATAP